MAQHCNSPTQGGFLGEFTFHQVLEKYCIMILVWKIGYMIIECKCVMMSLALSSICKKDPHQDLGRDPTLRE